jgi:hypothetical protein
MSSANANATTTLQSASDLKSGSNTNATNATNAMMPTTNSNAGTNYPEPVPTMEKQLSSTPFWINDPTVLFKREEMMDIWPAPLMSIEQKMNAISRIVILLSILGFLITKNVNILLTGAITLAIFVMMYKLQHQEEYDAKNGGNSNDNGNGNNNGNDKKKEGFINSTFSNDPTNNQLEHSKYSKPRGILKPNMTTPTVTNPMMNVLLPEIAYNPERNQAAPAYNPKIEKEINHTTEVATVLDFEPKTITEAEKLRKKLFADLGDKYEFDDSMRSFYTNPSTTIPNDQQAFAEFCYGSMISCKQGNEFACQRFNPVLGSVLN